MSRRFSILHVFFSLILPFSLVADNGKIGAETVHNVPGGSPKGWEERPEIIIGSNSLDSRNIQVPAGAHAQGDNPCAKT